MPKPNLYDQLKTSIAEAEHVANATADNGGDPGYAQAMIQIVIAKALVDISESLDSIRKSAMASIPPQLP